MTGLAAAAAAVQLVGWPALLVWWLVSRRPEPRRRWYCPHCHAVTRVPITRPVYEAHLKVHERVNAAMERTQRVYPRWR